MRHQALRVDDSAIADFEGCELDLVNRLDRVRADLDALAGMVGACGRPSIAGPCVHSVIKKRRARNEIFGESLFTDPAWDILLALYACESANRRISVAKLAYAANVPGSTSLRWIGLLEQSGLLVRQPDTHDGRRFWVNLTIEGRQKMERYFSLS